METVQRWLSEGRSRNLILSAVHGNSNPLLVVMIMRIGNVGGRLVRRIMIFESIRLRARFPAARSVLNKSAAMKTCDSGPKSTVLTAKTHMRISGNVSAIRFENCCNGAVKRTPPKGSPCCVPVIL
jgi:hypothetical protein